jgi:hypothetical protein
VAATRPGAVPVDMTFAGWLSAPIRLATAPERRPDRSCGGPRARTVLLEVGVRTV